MMSTRKKIYFLVGAVLLLALTILLSYFYSEDEFNQPVPADLMDPDNGQEEDNQTDGEDTDGNMNVTEDDGESDTPMDSGELTADDSELESAFEEASSATDLLNSGGGSPGEQTYYVHFRFANEYMHNLDTSRMDEEERREDAQFKAQELVLWTELAEENYDWTYSEEAFERFIEQENVWDEESRPHRYAAFMLDHEEGDHALRYSETRFLQRFILNELRPELEREIPRNEDEDDEDYEYRLYRSFIQEVMEELD
ncbi:hypothetical protein [Alteribacter natronophilus]|uniref:hypothetical protein n=1 Tax=Alteribacter natronophilus TaxID=2583810 RepID=UPI00110DA293|nr:hypothetical protein [Alteribacter natronophilus]TMW71814.1 hypothetical protein FGB90_12420 [Alteribacter natronophilus]